ncbi:sporulation killing factor [Peribacillus castrilensis]|uniref:Sporulation killing factor n=1 Tax=Peribacillus simplex TaxID=1478 RepID=A0AAN2PK79_9BACI|nr:MULTISPECIES: sporulation killing factor [Bacillaceae]MCP1093166.1 sporulation killing factor [Bacillaceae bacterium OS4b]MBD8586413.1 sporulation killing factor [Peribacillus simplex]MCF7623778.1 sporulation killing factor [Peribacillus frigoritolerans]MCP1154325.1 sporulation killing factor [Peribacillus frigoritolerans]MCT1390855.1 sporulation killing factor [Peribacillus frigoritolerans]
MEKDKQKLMWESSTQKSTQKQGGVPLVKSVGCAACWAAKSISLTRSCLPPTPINLAL